MMSKSIASTGSSNMILNIRDKNTYGVVKEEVFTRASEAMLARKSSSSGK